MNAIRQFVWVPIRFGANSLLVCIVNRNGIESFVSVQPLIHICFHATICKYTNERGWDGIWIRKGRFARRMSMYMFELFLISCVQITDKSLRSFPFQSHFDWICCPVRSGKVAGEGGRGLKQNSLVRSVLSIVRVDNFSSVVIALPWDNIVRFKGSNFFGTWMKLTIISSIFHGSLSFDNELVIINSRACGWGKERFLWRKFIFLFFRPTFHPGRIIFFSERSYIFVGEVMEYKNRWHRYFFHFSSFSCKIFLQTVKIFGKRKRQWHFASRKWAMGFAWTRREKILKKESHAEEIWETSAKEERAWRES